MENTSNLQFEKHFKIVYTISQKNPTQFKRLTLAAACGMILIKNHVHKFLALRKYIICNLKSAIKLFTLSRTKLQTVRQLPQTEQTRAGHSFQAENWAQQT